MKSQKYDDNTRNHHENIFQSITNMFQQEADEYKRHERCDSRTSTVSCMTLASMSSLFEDVKSVDSIFNEIYKSDEFKEDEIMITRLEKMTSAAAAEYSPFQIAVKSCPSKRGNAIYRLGKKAANNGEWARAVHYYHIALVKQRSYYGENHLKSAETLNSLGLALMELGELLGAITALEECLAIRQELLGPGAEECASTTTNICRVLDAHACQK